jgi:hypothetical protein
MAYKYIVTQPFHGYAIGQEITDPDEIAKVLADHDFRVVRVAYEPPPPPPPPEIT